MTYIDYAIAMIGWFWPYFQLGMYNGPAFGGLRNLIFDKAGRAPYHLERREYDYSSRAHLPPEKGLL